MVEVTFAGEVTRVVKNQNLEGAAGPYVRITITDNGVDSELWIFTKDLSAFNEKEEA
jgi:hypothetical protein